jgi:hypothetical protein
MYMAFIYFIILEFESLGIHYYITTEVSKKQKGKAPAGYKRLISNSKGNSMHKSLAALVVYIPCYRLQSVAPRIHVRQSLHWLEIGPRTDPMDSQRNSLNKKVNIELGPLVWPSPAASHLHLVGLECIHLTALPTPN